MKKSAPQHAAEIIQQRIRSGKYPVGKPLLGQRLLAEELGVGRPAIREAISALEGLGLLQVEPGRGVFVRDPKAVRSARWRFAAQYSLENVYTVRASLESLSVLLATQRATLAEVKMLERLTDKLAAAVKTEDLLAMSAADRAFHRELAELSGNPLLLEMLDAFDVVMTECRNLAFQDARNKHRTAPILEHHQIIAAIKSGDANAASRKMKTHILHAKNRAGLGDEGNSAKPPRL
jgi:GntR family transcriptional repressor for pyruvate dehydrogenase complex